ncbi:MAG: hypothetical protein ABI605_11300 [Rhizobacter sp.]
MADAATGSASAVEPLDNSARHILKGTLVPLIIQPSVRDSRGLANYGFVRQLALKPGETDAVRAHLDMARQLSNRENDVPHVSASTLDVFRSFEQPVVPSLRPGIANIAATPASELTRFANALVQMRAQSLKTLQDEKRPSTNLGVMMQSLNAAVLAARGLANTTVAQPIGLLNLERIEMVPAGIQRGELVATIPLAPGEETAVTHKEWSVTSKEFTSIVTDSLEQTSETGVTDNTDLSQSTTSQNQHSTQFNITGTVQGGIPMINGSSSAGVTAQGSDSQSATDSIKHATSITQKASARSRQEHKTTISTTTVTGTSESSTRVLKNTSATDPIRIDYFSLMRKWRVRLYRFGLRLTYDMVIPEPGAAMRRAYMEMESLQNRLGPFVFDARYSDITRDLVDSNGNTPAPGAPSKPKYQWLADRYGAVVKPYPADPPPIFKGVRGAGNRDWSYLDLEFNVPTSQHIKEMYLTALVGGNDGEWPFLRVMGAREEPDWEDKDGLNFTDKKIFAQDGSAFMKGATGDQKLTFWLWRCSSPSINLKIILETGSDTVDQWRNDVYSALYNAAQTKHYSEQQDIATRLRAIQDKLADVDTLTLRREESDEIMKNVLKFVLGTGFDFMPKEVRDAFLAESKDVAHGIGFDGPTLGALSNGQWSVLRQHEDVVRFINQAIEWENVVTFLYSYFWDVPDSWTFVRELRHNDSTRQAFLRAGSARVVLTVRKGWEARWMRFTQDGTIDAPGDMPATGPYLSIAQEIAAYDDRNYPGVAPANPAKMAVRLQDAVYTTSSGNVAPGAGGVSIEVASSAGFVVGLRVVLDVEDDSHIQEAAVITDVPDATHIVVDKIVHAHDGTVEPFAVLQPGEKGAMIAEWNEYTPSSGIDIAVTSNLATIA